MPSSPVGVCVKECDFILSGMYSLYFSRNGCPPAQKTQLDSDLGTDSLVPIAPSSLLGEEGHTTESSWEKEEGQFLPGIAVEEGCQQLSLSITGEHGAAVEPWTRPVSGAEGPHSEDPISLPWQAEAKVFPLLGSLLPSD